MLKIHALQLEGFRGCYGTSTIRAQARAASFAGYLLNLFGFLGRFRLLLGLGMIVI